MKDLINSRVKRMKLGQLNIPIVSRNQLIKLVTKGEPVWPEESTYREYKKFLHQWKEEKSTSISVYDVMLAIEGIPLFCGLKANKDHRKNCITVFIRSIMEAGFRGPWYCFSDISGKSDHLLLEAKKKGKSYLKEQSILLLGRLQENTARDIEVAVGKNISDILIGDLIKTRPSLWIWRGHSNNSLSLFKNWKKKLINLGFSYNDGIFFQEGTVKKAINEIRRDLKISEYKAHLVLNLSVKATYKNKVWF